MVVALLACGDDASGSPPADAASPMERDLGSADAEAARDLESPESDAGPSGESLVVIVQRGVMDEVYTPAAGAAVALDAPGGERMEGTTDVSGRVVFEGLDWSLGTIDLTSYVEGMEIQTYLDVERLSEARVFHTDVATRSHSEVTLSGTLRNVEPGFDVVVTEIASGNVVGATGTTYTLQVRAGEPLTLIAMQRNATFGPGESNTTLRWTVLQHEAIDADTTLDIDVSQQEEPEHVTGSVRFKPGSTLPGAVWIVAVTPGVGFLGYASRVQTSPEVLDYEIELLRLLPDDAVYLGLSAYPGGYGPFSFVRRRGYPEAGAQDVELPEIPVMETPRSGESVGLHDVIRWRGETTVLRVLRRSSDPRSGNILWQVVPPEGATEVTLPQLPAAVDVAAVIGSEPLEAYLQLYAEEPSGWERIAGSRIFEVLP